MSKQIGDQISFEAEDKLMEARWSYKTMQGEIVDMGECDLSTGETVDFFIVDPNVDYFIPLRGVYDDPDKGFVSPYELQYKRSAIN